MLKRIAAFLFIFAIAGQVYAGVCGCLKGERRKQHSCCKKQRSAGDSIKAKGCCEADCMARQQEKIAADRPEPAGKSKFHAVVPPPAPTRLLFSYQAAIAPAAAPPVTVYHRSLPRPPDLYLQNCAFLI